MGARHEVAGDRFHAFLAQIECSPQEQGDPLARRSAADRAVDEGDQIPLQEGTPATAAPIGEPYDSTEPVLSDAQDELAQRAAPAPVELPGEVPRTATHPPAAPILVSDAPAKGAAGRFETVALEAITSNAKAPTHDLRAPAREVTRSHPAGPQGWRLCSGAAILGLAAVLGLTLCGGVVVFGSGGFDQAHAWLQQKRDALRSGSASVWAEVSDRVANPASRTTTDKSTSSDVGSELLSSSKLIERTASDLRTRVDQVRAASEGSARDLGREIASLRGLMEQSQEELAAKLSRFGDRLNQVELQSAAVSARMAQPTTPAHAAAAARSVQRAAKATMPVAPKPNESETKRGDDSKRTTQTRGAARWTVRDVVHGAAVLDGPGGRIEVSRGDLIPGLGRVESIVRWGERWVVATSNGVVTAN